ERARHLYEQSLALLDGLAGRPDVHKSRAFCLVELASVLWYAQIDSSLPLMEEGLALCRAIGDRAGTARALRELARLMMAQGNYRRASDLAAESLALRRS